MVRSKVSLEGLHLPHFLKGPVHLGMVALFHRIKTVLLCVAVVRHAWR